MKKGLFRAFLMLCMLFVLVPAATATVLAEEDAHTHTVCVDTETCTDPAHTTENDHGGNINWIAVGSLAEIEENGYYYLTKDVNIEKDWKVQNGEKIVLCLNGHNINKTKSSGALEVDEGSSLTLTDCNGTKRTQYGQWNANKTNYSISSSTDGLEDGYDTLTGGVISTTDGSGVYVNGVGAILKMYGGTFASCMDSGVNINTSGAFYLYNGTIIGNLNKSGTNRGGGVSVAIDSDKQGSFAMYGGTIKNNYSTGGSGGVKVCENGTFTLSGGEISGNAAGTGYGGVCVEGGNLQVSGKAKITDNTGSNVYLSSGQTITIAGKLETGASIGVTMQDSTGIFTSGWSTNNSETATSVFFSDNSSYGVVLTEDKRELELKDFGFDDSGVSATTNYHKHDVGGTSTIFTPWTKTDELPRAAGNYVLMNDVTLSATKTVNTNITLDLNGHDIICTGSDSDVINVVNSDVSFTLYDCNHTKRTRYGKWVEGTYTIYTEDHSDDTTYDTLIGGIIRGGETGRGVTVGNGITSSSFTMYGGTIAGNTASSGGGGVYVASSSSFTMNGGTIAGNQARYDGGGVEAGAATFTMNGGEITDNHANSSFGGGVYVYGTFTMTGGSITGNHASGSYGGGVYFSGIFNLSGTAKITGNTICESMTNNVQLFNNQTITIAGELKTGASIGVTMYTGTGTFTSGWSDKSSATPTSVFFSDNSSYLVRKNFSNELELHVHSLSYTAQDNVITETCSGGDHEATATISAPTSLTYDGNAKAATVVYSTDWAGSKDLTITYSPGNVNAGEVTASITAGTAMASVTYTILPYVPTTYTIAVSSPENGTVQASRTRAASGTAITLTVTPDEGYALDTLTVTDKKGNALTLTEQDGTYTFQMPSSAVTVMATFVPQEDTEETCPSKAFTDLDTAQWYHESVDYVLSHSIMEGYGDGTFGPDKDLTRAQLAQILYNLQEAPQVTSENPFTDVDENQWYAKAVTWAYQEGVVEGYGNGKFGPEDKITRQDLAVMLWRYAGKPEATQTSLAFTDAAEVSDYAQEALLWANEVGIVQGDNDILDPKGNATRTQAAAMIMRYLELG